jgi:glycerol dehydrogenase
MKKEAISKSKGKLISLKVLMAPQKYVQGFNALLHLGDYLMMLGIGNPLLLVDPNARKTVEWRIRRSFEPLSINCTLVDFRGECTWEEIERITHSCIKGGHDAIINCGGGKTIDTGQCAAAGAAINVEKDPPEKFSRLGAGVPCINVPTVAATDAPTSAISLVYDEKGQVEATILFPANPAMVLVDTAVIALSPVRLLVAGMGDALATYFEADMCYRTTSPSIQTGALSTITARTLGKLCFDTLMKYGVEAKAEAEAHIAGPALEAVVEANVLLSGLGFESGGLSVAHAVGHAFHIIKGQFREPLFHGELVAFGTLTQLLLEGRTPGFLETIYGFCKSIGLPTTFDEMTLYELSDGDIEEVALSASRNTLITSFTGANKERDEMERFYDHMEIFNALKAADFYGHFFQKSV